MGSRFWKSIVTVIPEVNQFSKTRVKIDKSSFWFDKWLSSGPLCDQVDMIVSL